MPNLTTEEYGISGEYTSEEGELFTPIDQALKTATQRSTYQPYFEMFQSGADAQYQQNLNKLGMVAGGNASGFAGSSNMNAQSNAMQQQFGEAMVKVEDDIGNKMSQAQSTINDLIQGNKQTALTIKQMKQDGGGDDGGSCVLSTAAYKQGLINSEQMMEFVNWRLKTQHKEFLGNIKWLGYQITWKPISNYMLKHKWFARFIKRTILDKWINVIKGKKKHKLTKFFVEYTSVLGFALNYRKCMKLASKFKDNPKFILDEYKNIIIANDGDDKVYVNFKKELKNG